MYMVYRYINHQKFFIHEHGINACEITKAIIAVQRLSFMAYLSSIHARYM